MFSRPPSTMTTPAAHRTRGPYFFSKSSGIVITPESRRGLMQKPVYAHEEHRREGQQARDGPGEPFVEAVLGGVHARHDAELGGRERGDAQVDVHLPSRDDEVLDPADVSANRHAGDHRDQEVDSDDAAVKHCQTGHRCVLHNWLARLRAQLRRLAKQRRASGTLVESRRQEYNRPSVAGSSLTRSGLPGKTGDSTRTTHGDLARRTGRPARRELL